MTFTVKEKNQFRYLDEGQGEVLLLLHGLFGILSNWHNILTHFSSRYRVLIPVLPIYDVSAKGKNIKELCEFIEQFINTMGLHEVTIVGNSLGGHIGILYALENKNKVKKLVLTGSSGLFENTMGVSYPQRRNYDFIRERVAHTFYDPQVASKELIDVIFEIMRSIPKCIRIVSIARSAQKNNVASELPNLYVPTLLIWGLNDTITPPLVAHEFNRRIPDSELKFIDKCCHVPMMEHPRKFNSLLETFLTKTS